MKKKLLFIVLSAACLITRSQSVSYKVIFDDPIDVPNLFIHISPFYCEATATGNFANIGFALQGNYNMGKRLAFEASFARAYLDVNARKNAMVTGTDKPLSPHKQIEAGATFFYRSRIKSKKVQITMRSSQSSRTYITVPASAHIQGGVRGGILYYNYAIQSESGKESFTGTNPNTGQDTALSTFDYHGIATNMNVAGTYFGLIRRKTIDISIQAAGYGQRAMRKIGEVYLDVLFTPVITFSSVRVSQTASSGSPFGGSITPASTPLLYKLSNTASKFIGWRAGYQYILPKTLGVQARVEVGQKPGWGVKSGFYLLTGFSVTIGMKAKFTKPKTELEKTAVEK